MGIIANYHPSSKTRSQLEEEIFICSTTKHSRAEHYSTSANNNLTHDKLPTSLNQYGSYWCKHPKSLDNYWNCRETHQFTSKWNRVVGTSYAHSTTTFTPKLKLLNHNRRRMLNTARMRNNSQEILSVFASRRMARRKIVARCQVITVVCGSFCRRTWQKHQALPQCAVTGCTLRAAHFGTGLQS